MKFLNREELLKKLTLKKEVFELPNEAGSFYIREMTGSEYEVYADSIVTKGKDKDGNVTAVANDDLEAFRANLACRTICDDKGNLLFKLDDAKIINETFGSGILSEITEIASRLNGMGSGEEKAKN